MRPRGNGRSHQGANGFSPLWGIGKSSYRSFVRHSRGPYLGSGMEPDAAYSTPSGRQPTWRAPELAENAPVRYPARRLPLYGEKPGGRQAQSATPSMLLLIWCDREIRVPVSLWI